MLGVPLAVSSAVAGSLVAAAAAILVAITSMWVTLTTTRTFSQDRAISVAPGLFDARLKAYAVLWQILNVGREPTHAECEQPHDGAVAKAQAMTDWYYTDGNGFLLSNDAQALWVAIRNGLRAAPTRPVTQRAVWSAMSLLRTELKFDLQVRDSASPNTRNRLRRNTTDANRLVSLRSHAEKLFDLESQPKFEWPHQG